MFDAYSNFWQDLPVLLWMVFLRIIVPLAIVLIIGSLLWRNSPRAKPKTSA